MTLVSSMLRRSPACIPCRGGFVMETWSRILAIAEGCCGQFSKFGSFFGYNGPVRGP